MPWSNSPTRTAAVVARALSARKLTGTNANPGWLRLSLPEPAPTLGAAAALAALAICRGVARPRKR
jgi:hypothetical protein